jgi:phosphopantetheine adenylyltransferase
LARLDDDGGARRMNGERFAKGLVVGKFWPLHRGHQLLIDRAHRGRSVRTPVGCS